MSYACICKPGLPANDLRMRTRSARCDNSVWHRDCKFHPPAGKEKRSPDSFALSFSQFLLKSLNSNKHKFYSTNIIIQIAKYNVNLIHCTINIFAGRKLQM